MKFKEFITWVYQQELKGNINENAELHFLAEFGDAGYNKVKSIELDEEGNIILSAHD